MFCLCDPASAKPGQDGSSIRAPEVLEPVVQTLRELQISARAGLPLLLQACSLSLGAAIALGLARFSYALLLPPMKADLGWTFAQAGALNTSNALGYLAGALAFPLLSRSIGASRLFRASCVLTSLFMAAAGATFDFNALLAQRAACGLFSALIFIGGGVLAARLAAANPRHAGLVLGLYYGGVGWGIVLSALVVPSALRAGDHGWQGAWIALAVVCAACSALAWPAAISIATGPTQSPTASSSDVLAPPLNIGRVALLLASYALFGIGYIGYMTFVIALLRGVGMNSSVVTAFYIALGLAAAASGKLWSGILNRARGGGAFAFFCVLLSTATLVPAITISPVAAFASGILFGATFLAVVASTTSFVRHNLPLAHWSAGISTFTVVFALGQIIGPVVMGAISDGSGLSRGFVYSAGILLLGAAIAVCQKPLASPAMA